MKSDIKKNGSLDNPSEYYDRTSQSGSLSVEEENSDITLENELGTENTDDYEDDNFSALSENIEEEFIAGVANGSGSGNEAGCSINAATTANSPTVVRPPRSHTTTAPPLTTRSISSSGMSMMSSSGGGGMGSKTSRQRHSHLSSSSAVMDRNQNLQNVAAAVYNYHVVSKEVGHEYLNDIYNEEDEKVYEDLCYVTFSSKVSEVCIQLQLEFMFKKRKKILNYNPSVGVDVGCCNSKESKTKQKKKKKKQDIKYAPPVDRCFYYSCNFLLVFSYMFKA